MEIVRLKNFSFKYPNADVNAVDGMDLHIQKSEFVLVCGQSGCGKTTLLRNLKKEIAPHGKSTGEVFFNDTLLADLDAKESASKIGFVRQNPDNQIVTDTVWHELAFGLENLGIPTPVIRRRVAETAHFFGINSWFESDVFSLSGGQKQLLNLAAVMAMQPKLIILDEPTAQLDPIAAKEFLTVLRRINQELGTTVILSEHRLEDVLNLSDKVLLMNAGAKEFFGNPAQFIERIAQQPGHVFSIAMPSAVRISLALGETKNVPTTVRDGRAWLKALVGSTQFDEPTRPNTAEKKVPVLQAKEVWFRYNENFVLRNFSVDVYSGQIMTIVGGNASGKTTALSVMAGLMEPVRGTVKLNGKSLSKLKKKQIYKNNIAKLEQNPKTMFACDTVIADLTEAVTGKQNGEQKLNDIIEQLNLRQLLNKHPYDISGGEQQKVALGKLLLLEPKILLLDEPTKGIDVYAKDELAEILKHRCTLGDAIVIVTHDVEFAAKHSHDCAMIFNGEVMCRDNAKDFFAGNMFYTTSANRISRDVVPGAVIPEDVIDACKEKQLYSK